MSVADEHISALNKKINEGWQPQGGVTMFNGYFWQAMVKYEE